MDLHVIDRILVGHHVLPADAGTDAVDVADEPSAGGGGRIGMNGRGGEDPVFRFQADRAVLVGQGGEHGRGDLTGRRIVIHECDLVILCGGEIRRAQNEPSAVRGEHDRLGRRAVDE